VLLILAWINIGLCMFNLLPLFPLDGHHMLREALPVRSHQGFMAWQLRYGRLLLIGLIMGPDLLSLLTGNPNIPDPLMIAMSGIRKLVLGVMGIGL